MIVIRRHDPGEVPMGRTYQCFDLEWVEGVAVARLRRGNLDEGWIDLLGDELLRLIAAEKVRRLVISLGEMECLYSLLLGKLLRVQRAINAVDGRLKLIDVAPLAREVFAVCRLEVQFEFAPDLEAALGDW